MLLRPATSAFTEATSDRKGMADQDVVDQFRLAR
jgi:hypothetical protein